MRLYVFPVAPNPTRVRLYLGEKAAGGAALPLEEVPVNLAKGEQRSPEHLARNPRGALPVLELDDGSFLTESLAIVEYLEELHPEPPLIGRSALERARTRELDRVADLGVLQGLGQAVHATRSPLGHPPSPERAAYFRERAAEALGHLDAVLADGRPWLAGERVTLADATLAAGLQFARFGELEPDPLASFDRVAAWDARYRERPAAKSVLVC